MTATPEGNQAAMRDSLSIDFARRHLGAGRIEEAHRVLAAISKADPDNAEAWHLLTAVCGQLGKFDEAAVCARRTVALQPDFPGGYVNLGLALKAAGKISTACDSLLGATQLFPDNTTIRTLCAAALEGAERVSEAIDQMRAARAISPRNAEMCVGLGNLLLKMNSFDDAAAEFRDAIAADNRAVPALMGLAYVCRMQGRYQEAARLYRRVLELRPNDIAVRSGLAAALERSGHFDDALRELEPLIATNTQDLHALIVFSYLSHRYGRDKDAIALLNRALTEPQAAGELAVQAHFALGKLHDTLGAYDQAFESYRSGNRLKRATFDTARHREAVNRVIRVYSTAFMANAPRSSNDSALPVFIVGMPRSGTTLVEQILASHPDVTGAGELQVLPRIAMEIARFTRSSSDYPECMADIQRSTLDQLSEQYISVLRSAGPKATRVTDKLPGNWWNLGLIELFFPRARIVHVTRDPLDACLSCYFQNFAVGHEYSFDLSHLGSFFLDYQRLMRHWKSVLHLPTLTVSYEALVTEPEAIARQLLQFCCLDWDERCIRPDQAEREIATASYDQVRRPVYTTSIGRWKNYERHLQVLRDALALDMGQPR